MNSSSFLGVHKGCVTDSSFPPATCNTQATVKIPVQSSQLPATVHTSDVLVLISLSSKVGVYTVQSSVGWLGMCDLAKRRYSGLPAASRQTGSKLRYPFTRAGNGCQHLFARLIKLKAHLASVADRAILGHLSNIQHAVIPGHVGVIPSHPGQMGTIRAEPGGCHKVMTPCQHCSLPTLQICTPQEAERQLQY